ncbi:hypothetical protein FISHEDRAFT_56766 [Fistulina hepatica ATCC 64428]|uniref:Mediator of RNA polymerase II transcription subunit 7 n=1 Tax=Fistulina hepatica ATCC 64428 TaxID=1128425 RepID=A0A0D7AI25_9AGAR|nr:hypothetical protein FISHEDRAFT_56766 [Fistulina hepatica ATCC 64428]
MDDDDAELRNPFPSPPSIYTRYTSRNLRLLDLLLERSSDPENANQAEVLRDQQDVPDWSLLELRKPHVDWILEEDQPFYQVFGDTWFVKERVPSLEDLGGHQLYPKDPSRDRRPALKAILRSLLVSYSNLTSALLAPPPTNSSTAPPEWQTHVEWINVLSQNLMAAANDLRPVQARNNLELMMTRQLQLRREETKTMQEKCDAIESRVRQLRQSIADRMNGENIVDTETLPPATATVHAVASIAPADTASDRLTLNHNDIFLWADAVQ